MELNIYNPSKLYNPNEYNLLDIYITYLCQNL